MRLSQDFRYRRNGQGVVPAWKKKKKGLSLSARPRCSPLKPAAKTAKQDLGLVLLYFLLFFFSSTPTPILIWICFFFLFSFRFQFRWVFFSCCCCCCFCRSRHSSDGLLPSLFLDPFGILWVSLFAVGRVFSVVVFLLRSHPAPCQCLVII